LHYIKRQADSGFFSRCGLACELEEIVRNTRLCLFPPLGTLTGQKGEREGEKD
jgi:hypothetical protein